MNSEIMLNNESENAENTESNEVPEDTEGAESAEKVEKDYEDMLDFERQLFLDVLEKDALFISAKGLLMDNVILNLMDMHCDNRNLVIVLNSSESEEDYYIKKLNSPHVYSSTYQTAQHTRKHIYSQGGVHFITTRILVVDLLKNRVPIEAVTGFIVLRAHTILESCQEAFALRLYRQHNKTGFIKAFSNSAESFTIGFGHVERVMRTIFVKELYLWPRFHSTVIQDLRKYEPAVIEMQIPLPEALQEAQTCLLELMNQTVKELKQLNKTLDFQEITVENCIAKKFHKILQIQLDSVWYQLSNKTKVLVADLKILRHLIITMIHSDPVTFYSIVSKYMTKEYALRTSWVNLDAAEQLFQITRKFVYAGNVQERELNPLLCPKWETLIEIINDDIPKDLKELKEKHPQIDSLARILILCNDSKTCSQLQQILRCGPQTYLFYNVIKNRIPFTKISSKFSKKIQQSNTENDHDKSIIDEKITQILSLYQTAPKKPKLDDDDSGREILVNPDDLDEIFRDINDDETEEEEFRNSYLLTMSQSNTDQPENSQNETQFELCPELENLDLTAIASEKPIVLIQTFKDKKNSFSLKQRLLEMKPNYIIMYHCDMAAIRQIELYEAKNRRSKPLKVYFLVYAGTVEEQSYLTSLRREKEAFEYLIEAKSKMVVPDYQDGKSDDCLLLQRDIKLPEKNTRKAGGQEDATPVIPKIIVDLREFRSELPALIHRRGIEIEPATISVGDYILTPEICVERKSLSDLILSLNSGRLYTQCVQMSRYYTKPMLLIEFDQNKPFHLQSNFIVSSDVSSNDIQQKLQLLTIHFPKLKLIWSPSPYATAQLFEELKEGKDQPNTEYAISISGEGDLEIIERKYDSAIYDFIQKLPGINSRNIDRFLRHGKNLDNIIRMSEEELTELLQNPNDARSLYSILHEIHKPEDEEKSNPSLNKPTTSHKWKLENKFRYKKNKS